MIDATEFTLSLFITLLSIWVGGIVFATICVLKYIRNDRPGYPIQIKDLFEGPYCAVIFMPIMNILFPLSCLSVHYVTLFFKVTKLDTVWDRIKNTTIY